MAGKKLARGLLKVTLKDKSKKYTDKLVEENSKAVRRGAYLVLKKTKENLSATGQRSAVWDDSIPRLYWNATERTYTQSSEPGTPPNKQRGQLRASIAVQWGAFRQSARVGPRDRLVYGRVQELGGRTGWGVLPPRPYLKPAFDASRVMINRFFEHALKAAGQKI